MIMTMSGIISLILILLVTVAGYMISIGIRRNKRKLIIFPVFV